MDIRQFWKRQSEPPSDLEESIYALVAMELANKELKPGLWAKALADNAWNEELAKAHYVRMRYEQLRTELSVTKGKEVVETDPYREAAEFGLSAEEIRYLVKPIKAVRYLTKYGKQEYEVSQAVSKKKLTAVLKNGVLWVSDKPI